MSGEKILNDQIVELFPIVGLKCEDGATKLHGDM